MPFQYSYDFDFGYILEVLPELGGGLLSTLRVSVIAIVLSVSIGVLGGAVAALRLPVVRQVVTGYTEFFKNTPFLVQIFFFYFGLPGIGVNLSSFTVAWLALGLWSGAYQVENFRAGFLAVNKGTVEAASALGLAQLAIFRKITFPLGLRIAIPSATNTLVSLVKSSSYFVAIAFTELTGTAVNLVSLSFKVFEVFAAIAVIYLLLIWTLSLVMHSVEKYLSIPGGA